MPTGTITSLLIGKLHPNQILAEHPDAFVLGIFPEDFVFADHVCNITLEKSKTYIAIGNNNTLLPPDVKSITMKDLVHLPLIIVDVQEEQNFQNTMLKQLRKYGEPNIRFVAHTINTAPPIVASGIGVRLHIKFSFTKDMYEDTYRLVSIKSAPKFALTLLHHKDMPQDKVAFGVNLFQHKK